MAPLTPAKYVESCHLMSTNRPEGDGRDIAIDCGVCAVLSFNAMFSPFGAYVLDRLLVGGRIVVATTPLL